MIKFLTSLFKENEVVKSFAYNLQTKTTNPFFGTLIIVWVVRNWELVYTFFTFDDKTKLADRVVKLGEISEQVFAGKLWGLKLYGFYWNLILCIGISLLVMLVTFVFLAFTKYITGVYQDRVLPNIYERTSKYKIITIEKFESLDNSFNSAREELRKVKNEQEEIEKGKEELRSEIVVKDTEIYKLKAENLKIDEKLKSITYSVVSSEEEKQKITFELEAIARKAKANENELVSKMAIANGKLGTIEGKIKEKTHLNLELEKRIQKAYITEKEMIVKVEAIAKELNITKKELVISKNQVREFQIRTDRLEDEKLSIFKGNNDKIFKHNEIVEWAKEKGDEELLKELYTTPAEKMLSDLSKPLYNSEINSINVSSDMIEFLWKIDRKEVVVDSSVIKKLLSLALIRKINMGKKKTYELSENGRNVLKDVINGKFGEVSRGL